LRRIRTEWIGVSEIDFLPAEYRSRLASRRDQWYVMGLGAVLLAVLLGTMIHLSHQRARLRDQLAVLEGSQSELDAQAEELRRLEARRAELAFDAKFYCLLDAHPASSRVLVAVSTSCPPRLALNTVRVKPEKLAAADPKAPKTYARFAQPKDESPEAVRTEQLKRFTEERAHTAMTLEITGVAESDLALVELMERLERSDCFAEVKLQTAVDQQASQSAQRAFTVQCRLARVL
jgi:Tfp pilus assembly protein PilN